MKNVVALFSEAADTDTAIKKLSEAGLDTGKARVHSQNTIESSANLRAMPSANAGISGGTAAPGAAGTTGGAGGGAFMTDESVESYLLTHGLDGDEVAFFAHGIQEGGHIVIIQVENDEVDTARKVLQEAGGRAPQVG
jgi:hypothetical protein